MEALERSGISQQVRAINTMLSQVLPSDLMNLMFQELDAVAVTVRPGLPLSLLVGLEFAKRFAIDTK